MNVTHKLPSWSQMARIPASVERKTLPRVRVSGFGSFESDTIFIAAMLPWLRIHRSVRLWGLCLINPCDKYPSVKYTETFCNIYFYTLYPWLHHHNSKQVDRATALLCRFLYEVRCFGISKMLYLTRLFCRDLWMGMDIMRSIMF